MEEAGQAILAGLVSEIREVTYREFDDEKIMGMKKLKNLKSKTRTRTIADKGEP